MKKWLKYLFLFSILTPLMTTRSDAQQYELKKFVMGSGGMVAEQAVAGVGPSGPVLYSTTGQAAIEKRVANSPVQGENYDLYQGFWEPVILGNVSVDDNAISDNRVINYPNPFSSSTTIKYELDNYSYVTLKIYDITGNEIKTLVDGYQGTGLQEIPWDATTSNGAEVGAGSYIYELSIQQASSAGGLNETTKIRKVMIIVK